MLTLNYNRSQYGVEPHFMPQLPEEIMAERNRPISIQIPEEWALSEWEIQLLEHAFRSELAVVEPPGEPPRQDITPINTTRIPVEVSVIGAKSAGRKPGKKRGGKKGKK